MDGTVGERSVQRRRFPTREASLFAFARQNSVTNAGRLPAIPGVTLWKRYRKRTGPACPGPVLL